MSDTKALDPPQEMVVVSPSSGAETPAHPSGDEEITLMSQLKEIAIGSKINVMYVAVPIAFICGLSDFSRAATFVFSFLALIPLAKVLGDLTEDIALRTNDAIGALINVTFGNATELIISIAALRLKEYNLIKQSLIGSVFGNMLLVLGSSLLLGGVKNPQLKFNTAAAGTYMGTLVLSAFALLVPSGFATINDDMQYNVVNTTGATLAIREVQSPKYTLQVSQQMSLVMIAIYALYIWFQLKTHKHLFDGTGETGAENPAGEDEEEETPKFTFVFGVIATGIVTVFIAIISEFLVGTVEPAADALRISKHFIGLALIPVCGNVCEHASAITMAWKGKLDISLGISLGSCTQISMFAMPLMVLISFVFGFDLDMKFSPFLAATLFATVLLTHVLLSDGSATWLSGSKLLCAYLILCVAFFNTPDHYAEV